MTEPNKTEQKQILDGGTYEIIRNRLQKHKQDLQNRLNQLNEDRKAVFGALETKLIANDRISTENNCIARDIVSFGNTCVFGYNVHFGLRTDIKLNDVFSVYSFTNNRFEAIGLDFIEDVQFQADFDNLYKYYRNTIFARFAKIGNFLYMIFQLSESVTDIKAFKWLIKDGKLIYVDNRSDHEYKFPAQYEFKWQEVTRDMHRYGVHSHVSILDKVFVEAIGGDLTIKIEDNTEDGKGVYDEPVDYPDQTLDDAQYKYADLGNLILIDIKPFQEDSRFFVYNHKVQEVQKIDSLREAAVLLPDDQGIIFPTGYYLQTGEYHVFDNSIPNVKFVSRIASPNGEDYMFVFYSPSEGLYILMSYNVITQQIVTPIICNGYTILQNGELSYFKGEGEQTKHHVVQIWQTPYLKGDFIPSKHTDSLLYKIGNKDIVKAMAESNALINLLNKDDNYEGLYEDVSKGAKDLLDSYYWIKEPDTQDLSAPLNEISDAANAAIDEFTKVVQLKKSAASQSKALQNKADELFVIIKSTSFNSINDFVSMLTQLRGLRGETIELNDVRYVNTDYTKELENTIAEYSDNIAQQCVAFLLNDDALAPYKLQVEEKKMALEKVTKVIEAKQLEEEVNQIARDLELLIEIVSNLEIEDTSQSTKIIDHISLIFATLNQLKAAIKNKRKSLGSKEAIADFSAQIKLVDQSIINYLDIADTPEKCDEYQTKVSIQLEELEGKFADYDAFIPKIIEKREEVHAAFDNKKTGLIERRNKKSIALKTATARILKGVAKKAETLKSTAEINGYFASDLMINKVRDIIDQLNELDESGNAEEVATSLKVAKEDALRKLKDKQELYEDGENVIKLGKYKFGVNKQPLDLTIVFKDNHLNYHLTGTDFYQRLTNKVLVNSQKYWDQEYPSENITVYRGSYLAFKLFKETPWDQLADASQENLVQLVKKASSANYNEGYTKGVHDEDAAKILLTLVNTHKDLGLLRYSPAIRAHAQYSWYSFIEKERLHFNRMIKAAGSVLEVFPYSKEFNYLIDELQQKIHRLISETQLFSSAEINVISNYLFEELQGNDAFEVSSEAEELRQAFNNVMKAKNADLRFKEAIDNASTFHEKIKLARQWVAAFINQEHPKNARYIDEIVCNCLFDQPIAKKKMISPNAVIHNLAGNHPTIIEGEFHFNYHDFVATLTHFTNEEVPAYQAFKKAKTDITLQLKEQLKLEEYKPQVLTSFVRNKLIDQVYLPLFGENLSKQLGTVGNNSRTDRMGLLLLISPPGYGKTTLMEYIANRLGLVFMKINGPAIGHEVTSVDPEAATNSAAKEELKKLNLAFEMGNNVMLYLDDIQHCHPEFLQKFISLSDGTRKIEGIYNGKPRTYDLRGKKFCVIMAGNPYTERGAKFQVPDMLSNRADIYNLGDIIGDSDHQFNLSLIENSLTSNPVLNQLRNKYLEDVYTLLNRVENETQDGVLHGNHTNQEIQDYLSVIQKVLKIRDTVLKVNQAYIESAAKDDAYRTEPPFKLQGSYRDMNKLVSKVVPIMNNKELQNLLLSHYESEAQTLTSSAEANLLKYKELTGTITPIEQARWGEIKTTFIKNNKLRGLGNQDEMAQVVLQMVNFSDNLEGIKEVLERAIKAKG